jgi:hypothetical protein
LNYVVSVAIKRDAIEIIKMSYTVPKLISLIGGQAQIVDSRIGGATDKKTRRLINYLAAERFK